MVNRIANSELVLKVDIAEFQTQLLNCINLVSTSQEVIITENYRPVAKLMLFPQRKSLFGSDKDKIIITDDFDVLLVEFPDYM